MRPAIPDAADRPIVVRTDFSDDAAWRTVTTALKAPASDLLELDHIFVDDPLWAGARADEVRAAAPALNEGVVYLADATTMRAPHPLLAVCTATGAETRWSFLNEHRTEFRVLPGGLVDVSANLSIANMAFAEFAAMAVADPDGWYRGIYA